MDPLNASNHRTYTLIHTQTGQRPFWFCFLCGSSSSSNTLPSCDHMVEHAFVMELLILDATICIYFATFEHSEETKLWRKHANVVADKETKNLRKQINVIRMRWDCVCELEFFIWFCEEDREGHNFSIWATHIIISHTIRTTTTCAGFSHTLSVDFRIIFYSVATSHSSLWHLDIQTVCNVGSEVYTYWGDDEKLIIRVLTIVIEKGTRESEDRRNERDVNSSTESMNIVI